VIVALVVLRFQLLHAARAVSCAVHRSTITRAVGEIRPLLAQHGFAVPGTPSPIARNAASTSVTALTRGSRGVPSGCCG